MVLVKKLNANLFIQNERNVKLVKEEVYLSTRKKKVAKKIESDGFN